MIKEQTPKFTREQKEAVGLLSIGTFLEYFDLMLYVHMAVLLNDLFFPKYDPKVAQLLTAFTFCSTYLLRPIGAFIFGWIGDNMGRKASVLITTGLMSVSCVIMANLSTYAQIGISAAWFVTICRIVQGMTSMGEKVGAELYLTEYLKPPQRYVGVAFMSFSAACGTTMALATAFLVTSYSLNWRLAFWLGAGVALVGMIARTTLRETQDFVNAKKRLKNNLNQFKNAGVDIDIDKTMQDNLDVVKAKDKVSLTTAISLLLVDCMWPVIFYLAYMHGANILKYSFKYSAEQIIHNNFIVSALMIVNNLIVIYLSKKTHPLTILKVKLILSSVILLIVPFLLDTAKTGYDILLIQSLIIIFACDSAPANSIFFRYFAVLKRFTYTTVIYAISRALVYVITSFGLVYLTDYFGHYGIFFVIIPTLLGFAFGLSHFIKLEKEAGNIPDKRIYVPAPVV